jgi:flagellar biosynthesis protein FlhA
MAETSKGTFIIVEENPLVGIVNSILNQIKRTPRKAKTRENLENIQKKVLQELLKEQVLIKNKVSIMESIAKHAPISTATWFLVDNAREALSSQICHQYADEARVLHVLTLEPSLEQKIVESKAQSRSGAIFSALEPALKSAWIKALGKSVRLVNDQGFFPVILCSSQARYLVRNALEREFPEVAVLSVVEIAPDYKVKSVGIITLEQE